MGQCEECAVKNCAICNGNINCRITLINLLLKFKIKYSIYNRGIKILI